MIEPLEDQLSGYFHFFGVKGALLMQLGRSDEARDRVRPRDRARAHRGRGGAHPLHLDRLMKDSERTIRKTASA